jgi:hypothetical protein
MPAFTPRGYPYSIPTDPAKVAGAIQALAEAIDPDVQARADSVGPRATFRMSSTTIITFPSTIPLTLDLNMPFDVLDASVGDAVAVPNGPTARITPRLPGFWWFQGSITFPLGGAANRDLYGVSLRKNGTTVLGRGSSHISIPATDGSKNITCTAGAFFNGTTDYLELIGSSRVTLAAVGSGMNVRRRYLLATRMTEL